MAVHVEAKRIQLWLNSTKLVVDEVDPELESAASDYVLGRLDALYDISGWADVNTTPRLVQDIISMFMAAWQYRRAYAEVIQGQAQDFPVWLEMRAENMICLILDGGLDVPGGVVQATTQPDYWPNATTGMSQQYDASGLEVGRDEFSEDIKFRMGTVF